MLKDTAEAVQGRDNTRELTANDLPPSEDDVVAAMMAVFERAGALSPEVAYRVAL